MNYVLCDSLLEHCSGKSLFICIGLYNFYCLQGYCDAYINLHFAHYLQSLVQYHLNNKYKKIKITQPSG